MKRLLLLVVLLLCLSICAVPASANLEEVEPRVTEDTAVLLSYTSGKHEMKYWLYLPSNFEQGIPLVVFLHGDGEVAKPDKLRNYGIAKSMHEIYGNEYPFILIMPNTTVHSWTVEPIQSTLINLIDSLADAYDCSKIIITGHSRGATGVWHIVNKYNDYFSCAVPIGGAVESKVDAITIPVKSICCRYDSSYCKASSKRSIAVVSMLQSDCEYYVEGTYHSEGSYVPYTKELFDWMLSR